MSDWRYNHTDIEELINSSQPTFVSFDQYTSQENYGIQLISRPTKEDVQAMSERSISPTLDPMAQLTLGKLVNHIKPEKSVRYFPTAYNHLNSSESGEEEITEFLRMSGIEPESKLTKLNSQKTKKIVEQNDKLELINGKHSTYLDDDFFALTPKCNTIQKPPNVVANFSDSSATSSSLVLNDYLDIEKNSSSTSSSLSDEASKSRNNEENHTNNSRYAEPSIEIKNQNVYTPRQLYFIKKQYNR